MDPVFSFPDISDIIEKVCEVLQSNEIFFKWWHMNLCMYREDEQNSQETAPQVIKIPKNVIHVFSVIDL